MKLAIMQPYFLPYLGYFALIRHTDQWIIFDTPQFKRHSWIERNRILKPDEGWHYIKVPLIKFSRNTAINDVKIKRGEDCCKKILAQLDHYKKKAPNYKMAMEIMDEIVHYDTDSISELDTNALKVICEYLKIDFKYQFFSEFSNKITNVNNPDEWALEISKFLDADEYFNLPGGIEFFNKTKFDQARIKLKFLQIHLKEYNQKREAFESGLSIIDVMMFNSLEQINLMLDDFELI